MLNQKEIINQTANYVQSILQNDYSGHDWWHIVRVRNLALEIAQYERTNAYICEMAALLHDVADEKLNPSQQAGIDQVTQWLKHISVNPNDQAHILSIIANISFKGGQTNTAPLSLEGQIVQDADRLDALGAIGIARTMCYSGYKARPIHDPNRQPRKNLNLEIYRNGEDTAIMHFYEKLLKLKDLMNTSYAKKLAQGRHQFLENYLTQFYQEWEGKR